MREGARLAFSLLTVVPVGAARTDRATAGPAMRLAPLVGAAVGLAAGVVLLLAAALGLPSLVAGVAGVGTLALVTRGLHLDGLADTADGLGSYADTDRALAVMKAPDVGAFGVITLLLVGVGQASCLATLTSAPTSATVVVPVLAAATGRLAITWACRPGVPAARPGGLGALVAGTVSTAAAAGVTAVVLIVAAISTGLGTINTGLGAISTGLAGDGVFRGPLAVVAGLGAGWALVRHCVRRFGGITGDVFGAASEVATTVALVVLVAEPPSHLLG